MTTKEQHRKDWSARIEDYRARRRILITRGAKASACIYSVVETAKENGLKPFDYLKFLFEQLPQLTGQLDPQALEPFMPWSASLPAHCRLKS